MERELTHVPGAVPQDCDTPSEVLARAVEQPCAPGRQRDRARGAVRGGELQPACDERRTSRRRRARLELVLADLRRPARSIHEKACRSGLPPGRRCRVDGACGARPTAGPRGVRRRVACALLALRWYLVREPGVDAEEPRADDAAESLRRWLSRTETLISRSEATRRDWDRHLRPMLARQFEMATGQKRSKDRAAYQRHGHHAVRCGAVGVGGSRERVARRRRASPAPAGRRSTKFCNGWSRYDGEYGCRRDHHRELRDGARRDRAGGGRQARRAHADSHHRARAAATCSSRTCPALARR